MITIKNFSLLIFCTVAWAKEACQWRANNSTICVNLELKVDVPIPSNQSASEVIGVYYSKGSIGARTLSSFPEAKVLVLNSGDFDYIEDGALCSLPKLKSLLIVSSLNIPVLTKGSLKGCDKLERFQIIGYDDWVSSTSLVTEDALHEMTSLQNLTLSGALPSNFNKAYIEPLKNMKFLQLKVSKVETKDVGLFCTSPVIETLRLDLKSSEEITEAPFEGCSNLKDIYISGSNIADGLNPFQNQTYLEEMTIKVTKVPHITKSFLGGLQKLNILRLSGIGPTKVDADAFTDASHVRILLITEADLQDSDLEALKPLQELTVLNLSRSKIQNLDLLPGLPNLEVLILEDNSIQKFDLAGLKKKLPKLKTLDLIDNPTLPEFEEELKKEETIKIWYELNFSVTHD